MSQTPRDDPDPYGGDPYGNGQASEQAFDPQPSTSGPLPSPAAVDTSRCLRCGVEIYNLRIGEPCPSCGVPVGSVRVATQDGTGKAVAALVLGIVSIAGCFLYLVPGIACAILALVFAAQVRKDANNGRANQSLVGMANAGRICAIITLCMIVLGILVVLGLILIGST